MDSNYNQRYSSNQITIGKKNQKRKVPKTYIPKSLSEKDKKKQEESILKQKKRPKLESFKSTRSKWVKKFEDKYKTKITNKKFINDNLLSYKGQKLIIDKGMGAYFSSGSRPNQTKESWSLARLASSLLGGSAQRLDKNILNKYGKIPKFKNL